MSPDTLLISVLILKLHLFIYFIWTNISLKIRNKCSTVTHIILFVCFKGAHVHNEALFVEIFIALFNLCAR